MSTLEQQKDPVEAVHPVMRLLHLGIPLTLLVDLADPAGPPSGAIYRGEVDPR
ncbi:MAG TPA: hypothetical protein VGN54_04580 [Mycobacteriales bacterium]|nr:hypothetical protein [Mycobacteriales bacterium]